MAPLNRSSAAPYKVCFVLFPSLSFCLFACVKNTNDAAELVHCSFVPTSYALA